MRKAVVFFRGVRAGVIAEDPGNGFSFIYDDIYFADPSKPAISLTLPKNRQEYHSFTLFPFFSNMLSEGVNRMVQAKLLHIDEDDDFGILLATASVDTPGAVTVQKTDEDE